MSVAGLSAHTSIERAHEVANECRKLNKQLKECQEAAQTYNNRERLLGLPVTNVSSFKNNDKEIYSNFSTRNWLNLLKISNHIVFSGQQHPIGFAHMIVG
jgi:dynein heavy chain